MQHIRTNVENHKHEKEYCETDSAGSVFDVESQERKYVCKDICDDFGILPLYGLYSNGPRNRGLDPTQKDKKTTNCQ